MGGRFYGTWMESIAMTMASFCWSVLACFVAFIGEAVHFQRPDARQMSRCAHPFAAERCNHCAISLG